MAEVGGFSRWERRRGNEPASILILLPGEAFYRGAQTYRSDIRWMWKKLAGEERARSGGHGCLSLLVTDEYQLYKPQTNVIRGGFEDANLLWAWIKFVVNHSWWKQKRGQLRKLFKKGMSVPDMLGLLSTILIQKGIS